MSLRKLFYDPTADSSTITLLHFTPVATSAVACEEDEMQ